jgi:hypothetical protein
VVNLNQLPGIVDQKRFSSSYGTWVDLSAPGSDMWSTVDSGPGTDYAQLTGTSMASPFAAGAACLVMALHPTWTGAEVGEQLRATCDNVDAANDGSVWDRLGKGRLNALRAVTENPPSIRITNATFADADGNGQLNRGETVTVSLTLHDYRAATGDLSLTLTPSTSDAVIVDGSETIGAVAQGGTVVRPAAFTFTVSSTAAIGAQLELRVNMTATGYSDFQWLVVPIEPLYETHDVNKLHASLAATGSVGWIGFPGVPGGPKGRGLQYDGSPDVLFEGGLLIGTDATHLADAVRIPSGSGSGTLEHQDFAPGTQPPPIRRTPGLVSAQETRMSFVDVGAPAPLGVRVTAESRAYTSPTQDDFLFLGYRVTNTTGATKTGMRVGLFFDWDIDSEHYATNRADWDPVRGLGYAWDTTDPSLPYMGIMVLKGGTQTIYAAFAPGGFTDALKWEAMTGGQTTSTGPGDVANMLSTGPFTVAPGDSVAVWFALLGGHTLAELQANADQARTLWNSIVAVGGEEGGPGIALARAALAPNPFTGGTRLAWRAARAATYAASVYDTRGRRVRSLGERAFAVGPASLEWDGRDDRGQKVGAGVYFLRVDSGVEHWTKKAVVLR